ncbi:UNC-50 [Atractiella rhizophila]|nr:UNC-50 [Atractiella rhizophila]
MAVLPLSAVPPLPPTPSLSRHPRLTTNRSWLKRLVPSRWTQLDFELASWQIVHLVIAPRRVYRNVYYQKQTKNTWARDDPAMLVLLSASLIGASVFWTLFYLRPSSAYFRVIILSSLRMIGFDFLLPGLVLATLLWWTCNRFLATQGNRVEWSYALDVHLNSFVPILVFLYYIQLILAPVLRRDNWVCLLLGNSLYLVAVSQYIYVTYLGYNALPFIRHSQYFLAPIALAFILYVISLLGYNVPRNTLDEYWRWAVERSWEKAMEADGDGTVAENAARMMF